MSGPYTLTVHAAYPGTPLFDARTGQIPTGETSLPGHMWYEVSDGQTKNSYGFQPVKAGQAFGPGKAVDTDSNVYQNPGHSISWEISGEQYQKLREFGEDAVRGDSWRYFNGRYNSMGNNCIDFTWGALRHAGMPPPERVDIRTVLDYPHGDIREEEYVRERGLKVVPNMEALRALEPPVPGSPLNQERENPPPDRSWLQRLLTENDARDSGGQPEPERQAAQQALPTLSPVSQTLLHDARREVQGLAQQHGLAWEQGLENTVWSVAAQARQSGLTRVEMLHAEGGQIRLGQLDWGILREAALDARQAANTAPEQSAQVLAGADREQAQAQAQMLEREQQAHQSPVLGARSGPVLG